MRMKCIYPSRVGQHFTGWRSAITRKSLDFGTVPSNASAYFPERQPEKVDMATSARTAMTGSTGLGAKNVVISRSPGRKAGSA